MWNIPAWRTAVTDKPLGIKGQGELNKTFIYSEIQLEKPNKKIDNWALQLFHNFSQDV